MALKEEIVQQHKASSSTIADTNTNTITTNSNYDNNVKLLKLMKHIAGGVSPFSL